MIKRLAREVLKRLGIVAFKRSTGIHIPEEESYRIVSDLVGRKDPVVIDGGAHCGGTVDGLSLWLPRAEFHCFEPDPMLAQALRSKFGGESHIHLVQAALGDVSGKATFNINASRATNSLLPSAEVSQPDLKQLCELVEQVEVDVISIDEYCRTNSINHVDVIKLDLQGHDYLALKGATTALEKARVVLVEVLFEEIYQGCHLFPDILRLTQAAGFDLYTLCGLQYGGESQLRWGDAIFVKHR